MKKYLLFFILIFCCAKIHAQLIPVFDKDGPVMTFDSDTFNFGAVTQGTILEHDFKFKNTGKEPLIISEVHGCCNCDVASYPSQPIPPGKSGVIHYRFDTEGKLNSQDKTTTVSSNNQDGTIVLHTIGNIIVAPNPNAPVMKFDSAEYHFGKIHQGEIIKHDFYFTNIGREPLLVTNTTTSYHGLVPECTNLPIKPGERGVVHMAFATSTLIGQQDKTSNIISNSKGGEEITLYMIGEIIPPEKTIPDTANAPVMTFKETSFDFGTVEQGKVVEHDYLYTNTGKNPLIITGAAGSCPCTVALYWNEPVAPGKNAAIHFRFDSSGKMGAQDKTYTIESNNKDGTIVLHIKGIVIAKPTNDPNGPIMTFESTTADFGTINQGDVVEKDLKFTNTGKQPLLILSGIGDGHMAMVTSPSEPIAPGKSGICHCRFDASGCLYKQDHIWTITYNANYNPTIVIHIICSVVEANAPIITFDTINYNLGSVVEGKQVEKYFHFTNTGKSRLIITDCKSQGGIDVPTYPQKPIPPGGTGTIKFPFSTIGKTGLQFSSCYVTSNAGNETVVLDLMAYIIPDTTNAPVMKFETTSMDFGTVIKGTKVERDFKFTNTGKQPLIITGMSTGCICTNANYTKEPIPPGKTGTIHLIFDTNGKLGFQDKTFYFSYGKMDSLNEPFNFNSNNNYKEVVLHLTGNVISPPSLPANSDRSPRGNVANDNEIFSDTTNAPILTFDSTSYHFGNVKQGGIITRELHFKNTGKTPLIISSTFTACGCDVADYPMQPIPPGGSGIIKYTFNAEGRGPGNEEKQISIESNNRGGMIVIRMYGRVVK
jgi:ribosomal protein L30E